MIKKVAAKKASSKKVVSKKAAVKKMAAAFKSAAKTNSGRIHIVHSHGRWSVKKEGAKKSIAVRDTKDGAINVAKNVIHATSIIVHKKDGTISKLEKTRK